MDVEARSFSVGVYGIVNQPNGESNWVYLPAISEYLSQIQILPAVGDLVATFKPDWTLLGLDALKGDFRSVLVVKERIIAFGLVDVGIICQFQEEESAKLPSQW